jgi:putative transposase
MSDAFYTTDLTDAEWQLLAPWIPAAKPGGRPRTQNMRMVVNAILYVLRSGCHWRLLPHEYPNWKTVYHYFWKWRQQGLWQQINRTLRGQARRVLGRAVLPRAAILDSQSAKTTDTQGFLLNAVVQEADLADRDGAYQVLDHIHTSFPRLKHVWMDMGYRSERLRQWMIAQHLEQEIVQKPRRWVRCPIDQEPPPMPAFTVLKRRWIVEMSQAECPCSVRNRSSYDWHRRSALAIVRNAAFTADCQVFNPGRCVMPGRSRITVPPRPPFLPRCG